MTGSFLTLAMAGQQGQGAQQMSPVGMIGWFVIMIAIFYFILIRPQQRREKERKALISAIKTGDRVLFAGGIIGTVANCKDKTLVIKIADNVKIEVSRGAVSQVLAKGEEPEDTAA
ncbi:MAG: preprotein translocase subunit YajC [Verrucomicrobia bacterium]|nr:preprotein translocase subunit YajC [Verrucomicrobiota bacterium]